jgi:hypothetical protein
MVLVSRVVFGSEEVVEGTTSASDVVEGTASASEVV